MIFTSLILAAVAQSPPGDAWKPVKVADNSFAAEMPAEAKLTTREVSNPQGGSFRVDLYAGRSEGTTFAIQAMRYSGPIPDAARETILDGEAREYIAARRGEVIRSDQVAVDGRPGWDLTIRGPQPDGKSGVIVSRCRTVLSDQTLYALTVVSPVDRPLPEASGRFFRSFRLDPAADRPATIKDETPEQAMRTFLTALAARDAATLEAVAGPTEGLEMLIAGPPMRAAQVANARKAATTGPIKALKAGEEYPMIDGRKLVVADEDVTEDRALLWHQGAAQPTRLRKVEGHWKVEAQTFVDARKAAEASKGKAKMKKGGR